MRKLYGLFILIVLILVTVNVGFYLHIYRQQLNYQKDILLKQTQICGWEIERKVSEFQNELQRILFTKNINNFFTDPEAKINTRRNLEVLFSKYSNMIASIHVVDNQNNVFNLTKDKNNVLLSDQYQTRTQREILNREQFEKNNGTWTYLIPSFSNDLAVLNILVTLDINLFVKSIFENYHIENNQWQLLLDSDGSIRLHNHTALDIELAQHEVINSDLSNGNEGSVLQAVKLNDKKETFITAYYPVSIFTEELGVLFSISTERILTTVILNIVFLAAATFLILIVIILIFLAVLQRKQQEEIKLKNSELSLRTILESLPVGIFFINPDKTIRTVNKSALEILRIADENILLGKETGNLFFEFKDLPLLFKDEKEKSRLFVYYDQNDNEILLFKKTIPLEIHGESIELETFVDITPLENARKAESAANTAKSDFINKISQDIRTPLNGILSMSEDLSLLKDLDSDKKNKVEIIRKSAELLLSVINDLIDFSKTEIGKVLVDETPFSLQSEIEFVTATFSSLSEEMSLPVFAEFDENLPEEIIGDPFILRQILTNLLSNALKHSKGERVLVSSKLIDSEDESLTLEVTVQDDGVGMPKDILSSLNSDSSLTQSSQFHGMEGLLKCKKLVEIIHGNLMVESPSLISTGKNPGTLLRFTFRAYSNISPNKGIDLSHIRDYPDVKVLIFNDPKKKDNSLQNILKDLEIKSETTQFNETSISLLKARASDRDNNYSMIIILDTPAQNGFTIAREIFINDLSDKYLIMMISSNNRPGNLLKSKRMGVDHYLLFPFESSEIFDFVQNNFRHIEIPKVKPFQLKKIRHDISILVAEDNAVNQKVAQIIFKNLGFEIDIAPNGQKAVSMVREKEYDIIFMDIRMPIKTGFDATYEIRKLGCTLPIIALTANVSEIDRTKALEVGMNDFLGKPVRVENIKNILIKWFSVPV